MVYFDVVFHSYVPTKAKERFVRGMKWSAWNITEVDSIEGERYEFEFGYASVNNISLIMGRVSWRVRMGLWLDIIEHDPSQLASLRAILKKEEKYDC